MKKIVLAGGSGFLGQILTKHFSALGWKVVILSRSPRKGNEAEIEWVVWDGKTQGNWVNQVNGADVLVNLAGRSVNCRYNEKNKADIYASRLDATKVLGEAMAQCSTPPKVFIQTASATIYRHSLEKDMDERQGEIGDGFSVDVCNKWEHLFWQIDAPQTRKVLLRVAMVMGREGGAYEAYSNLAKMGIGGKQGSGKQYVSWIHEIDFAQMVAFAIDNDDVVGTYNCSAPEPVPNAQFMSYLRQSHHRPFDLPAPEWMLELGAFFMGTETELVLKSRRVVPTKMVEKGFQFQYPKAREALLDLSNG
ncbi:MAG: TIGR01777 family oxidoreductase [Bacteroidota bacterium]